MKRTLLAKMVMVLGLTAVMLITLTITAMATTNTETPTVARTRAWDGIEYTLGGIPENVRKIEYQNSIFYLAPDISDDDFITVLNAGAEAVNLKPPQAMNSDMLYMYPVYILWNSDKTVLLVHPIIWNYDDILEAVAIPADPPARLTGAQTVNGKLLTELTVDELTEYMLSVEYADAVRTEFYRLLNEHRTANGLRELEINEELEKYADIRADEQRTRFGHTRPNGNAAGSGWHNSRNAMNTRYAENVIACGALSTDPKKTAQSIFDTWKNSAGHNRHMIYNFDRNITMAFGIAPKLEENGLITSGAVFATGY